MDGEQSLKNAILKQVEQYCAKYHRPSVFSPGKSRIHYAGRNFDAKEMCQLVEAALDFWLTSGPFTKQFENAMKSYHSSSDFVSVNSGSSGNLLMVAALCAPSLRSELGKSDPLPLEDGDEVITSALAFPTTVAPILQNRLVPVFLDCEIGTYNINLEQIEKSISRNTKALMLCHTMGVPSDMDRVLDICRRHNLWLLEDSCDAIGAEYRGKKVGSFGTMSSFSFYPAHQMTTGEGGGININHPGLRRTVKSLRDWGRDCWCETGVSDTCKKRFGWSFEGLPNGYDHKYVYTTVGYNLKMTELQAAVGLAQLRKLPQFIALRQHNFWALKSLIKDLESEIVLPQAPSAASISPFCFPMTLRNPKLRGKFAEYLEASNIEVRYIFGGNITKQPAYRGQPMRIPFALKNTDIVMNQTLFVGVHPGIPSPAVEYMAEKIHRFFRK